MIAVAVVFVLWAAWLTVMVSTMWLDWWRNRRTHRPPKPEPPRYEPKRRATR